MKATPDSGVSAFGLAMVNVSVVCPLTAMDAAPNDFRIDGGDSAVSVATAEPVDVALVPLSRVDR